MDNTQFSDKCLKACITVVIAVIVFYWFVFPKFFKKNEGFAEEEQKEPEETKQEEQKEQEPQPDSQKLPENYYFLDDGADGKMSIQHNLCSRSCCSEQYPPPFKLKYDSYVCKNKDKFVPSQVMCNNTFQDSGCLCMTKEQAEFLTSRGGNH